MLSQVALVPTEKYLRYTAQGYSLWVVDGAAAVLLAHHGGELQPGLLALNVALPLEKEL